jgi:hypothetical protein
LTDKKKVVTSETNLIPGSIIRNWKGEYGVVMQDKRILNVSKEEAERIAGVSLDQAS